MNLNLGEWKFDESVVPIFDEHVNQSVPMYEEIHNLIGDISTWYLLDGTNMYDIGTSTGKVIHTLKNKHPSKKVNYIGIDNSKEMIEKVSNNLPDAKFIYEDVTEGFEFKNASLITSVLTMQFIQEDKRQYIINNVYEGLNKGSAFILVEKVIGNNSRFNEIWNDLYHELKLKNGLSEKHVFDKARAIRGIMKPYTVQENTDLLKNAGFKDIDMFFKWNNFVGFIAVK